MKINYIIASYPGITNSRINSPYSEECVDIHLKNLKYILQVKKEKQLPCLISRITVMILKCKNEHQEYKNFYKVDEWKNMFNEFKIEIVFLNYIGENKHHSYDQWIQGMMNSINDCFYHILIEDDYVIHPECIDFDVKLIDIYSKKFKNNIGYLSQRSSNNDGLPYHACISNGIISSDTMKILGNPLSIYYKYNLPPYLTQLAFSLMFTDNKIGIENYGEYYRQPFWCNNKILDLSFDKTEHQTQ